MTITASGDLLCPRYREPARSILVGCGTHNTDDLGMVFVNGKLEGARVSGFSSDFGWIEINDQLVPGQKTGWSFASWNDVGPVGWILCEAQ